MGGDRIGKYLVVGRGDPIPGGSFSSSAHLTWEDGAQTKTRTIYYERRFTTEKEAVHHAVHQVYLRVMNHEDLDGE